MVNRKRNTAVLLISAGLFIVLGNLIGFYTVAALLLLWLGLYKIRAGENKTGYALLIIAGLILLSGYFAFFLALILISFGFYFVKGRKVRQGEYVQKQKLLESLKRTHEPWELKNMGIWSLAGEIHLDLSLAITNQRETNLVFQGLIGDVDLIIPEDIGAAVNGTVLLGQIQVEDQRDAGLLNKISWRTDNYETAEQKVNIEISYLIGDLHIKCL